MLKIGLSAFLAVALFAPLVAQSKVTDKGIPRLQNGEPNTNAPAPRYGIVNTTRGFPGASSQVSSIAERGTVFVAI